MAKFSQAFLQGILQPSYQQGLFNAARSAGQLPAVFEAEKERERREKGKLGGNLAVENAAQAGTLTNEMLRGYAGSMSNLGVSSSEILKNISSLRNINAQAVKNNQETQQRERTKNFAASLGDSYLALYQAGESLSNIRQQYLKDQQQTSINSIVEGLDLDIDPRLAGQLTPKQLFDIMENQKSTEQTETANKNWVEWIRDNPEINDANRSEGLSVALKAFGADAPAKLAELESKILTNKASKSKQKVVKAVVTLNTDSVFADIPGMENKSNLKSVDLAVDSNGNLTDESIKFLEANATSAFVPSINKSWSLDKKTNNTILGGNTPSGQGGEGSTLGQIIGPDVVKQALQNLEF